MILTWNWASSNLGDLAVTAGSVELVRQATGAEPQVAELGDDIPPGGTVVFAGGEHIYSGYPMLEQLVAPLRCAGLSVILPATVGPFEDDVLPGLADHVSARDEVSAGFASHQLGREVPVLADPAFFLTGQPVDGETTIFAPRREDIGLRLGRWESDIPVMQTAAFETYRGLVSDDGVLVAHSERDIELCVALSEACGVPWVRPDSLDRMLGLYRTCKAVVTSRFHGAVFGLGYGKPVVKVPFSGHGHKLVGLPLDRDVAAWKRETVHWVAEALGG